MSETSSSSSVSAPADEGESGNLLVHAAIGAVVTIVTSFIPLSPVLGGAVAGYLHEHDGLKVGAWSGLIAAIPVVLVVAFIASVFVAIPVGAGGEVGLGIGILVIALFAFLVAAAISAALGALGGYIGVYLKNEA